MLQKSTSHIETSDGWKLSLHRYAHEKSNHFPVFLIHGLGVNHLNVDFPIHNLSLAQYLHKHGFDVWMIDLRGCASSQPPQKKLFRSPRWNFDDYVMKDIPAVLDFIQKKTKKKKVHWVGHSIGGTITYSAIGHLGSNVAASATVLGASMTNAAKPGFLKIILKLDPLIRHLPDFPNKKASRILAPLIRWIAPLEDNFYYSIDNMDLSTMTQSLKFIIENVSKDLLLQMHSWYTNSHFRSVDGTVSYRNNLKKIKTPFLVCAGSVDGITPYPDVHFGFQEISSKDKKFMVFGKQQGMRTEYGHIDLVVGKNAPREVFPQILNWINTHD